MQATVSTRAKPTLQKCRPPAKKALPQKALNFLASSLKAESQVSVAYSEAMGSHVLQGLLPKPLRDLQATSGLASLSPLLSLFLGPEEFD